MAALIEHGMVLQSARGHEEHTESGAHRVREQPFPEWVPDDVIRAAGELSEEEGLAELPPCLITP